VAQGTVLLADIASGRAVKVHAGQYSRVAPGAVLAALPATGRILREYWTNSAAFFAGPVPPAQPPDGWDYLDRLESKPLQPRHRFKERIRGFVHPPVTGLYRFALSNVQFETALHISRTDKPEDAAQVAWRHPDGGGSELDQVTPIPLTAGRTYYIEAIYQS